MPDLGIGEWFKNRQADLTYYSPDRMREGLENAPMAPPASSTPDTLPAAQRMGLMSLAAFDQPAAQNEANAFSELYAQRNADKPGALVEFQKREGMRPNVAGDIPVGSAMPSKEEMAAAALPGQTRLEQRHHPEVMAEMPEGSGFPLNPSQAGPKEPAGPGLLQSLLSTVYSDPKARFNQAMGEGGGMPEWLKGPLSQADANLPGGAFPWLYGGGLAAGGAGILHLAGEQRRKREEDEARRVMLAQRIFAQRRAAGLI